MDSTMISAYRALNEAQAAISRANTLDEALQDGLRIILANCDAEFGVIWYADPKGDDALHPFFWVGKWLPSWNLRADATRFPTSRASLTRTKKTAPSRGFILMGAPVLLMVATRLARECHSLSGVILKAAKSSALNAIT
jgi:hypothetical protein